jgi:hypothetical protein
MNELISTRIHEHAVRLTLPNLAENLDGLLTRAQADTMGLTRLSLCTRTWF